MPTSSSTGRGAGGGWIRARIAPSIYLYSHPFRIYEYKTLAAMGRVKPTDTVLDLGCGHGKQTACLAARAARVVGIDVGEDSIRHARAEAASVRRPLPVEFVCSTLEDAHFPAQSFDKIFSFSVIEHIANLPVVLAECRKILKEGGSLIASTDSLGNIRDEALRQRHRREHAITELFTVASLARLLTEAGFRDVTVRPIFRSDYARRLFERGVREGFRYGRLQALAQYAALVAAERVARGDQGVFLVARAVRQAGPA